MAIACVRIPHFSLRVTILARPELDGQPLVLRPPTGRREIVIDAVPEAIEVGIRPGMLLRDVPALCPDAVVCAAQPSREAAILTRILDHLETFSPLVAADPDEPGTFYIDLRGLNRHFASSLTAAQQLLTAVPPLLRPRAGVAPNLIAARLAAGCASPGGYRLVEPAELRPFLRNIAISELPISAELCRQFERLGVFTLGELSAFPSAAIAARLGPPGRRAWELAMGHDDRQIQPRPRIELVREQLTATPPLVSHESFLLALKRLILRAFSRPLLRHRHVRQLEIRAQLEDGTSWERQLMLREPSGRNHLLTTLELRLRQLAPPGPVETLALELSGLTPATARQEPLLGLGSRSCQLRRVSDAVRRLTKYYGDSPLHQIVEVETWSRIPERRFALIRHAPLNLPRHLTVTASDGLPRTLLQGDFQLQVIEIQGEWQIDDEWWREPISRNYFQLILGNGTCRTIYHDLVADTWYAQSY